MSENNNAGSAPIATPTAAKAKKKQFLTEVEKGHKTFIEDLVEEFDFDNAREAFRVLFEVATSFRFDSDGNDRFEAVAKAIENERARVKATERRLSLLERMKAEAEAAGMTLAQYLETGAA